MEKIEKTEGEEKRREGIYKDILFAILSLVHLAIFYIALQQGFFTIFTNYHNLSFLLTMIFSVPVLSIACLIAFVIYYRKDSPKFTKIISLLTMLGSVSVVFLAIAFSVFNNLF